MPTTPVHWHPWNEDTLRKAQRLQKPLLISIGYAACHWCHVMEHETFESIEAAEVMNTHFVNIKIDREELPDVDMLYMNAVQIMTGSGGWPLHVVAYLMAAFSGEEPISKEQVDGYPTKVVFTLPTPARKGINLCKKT